MRVAKAFVMASLATCAFVATSNQTSYARRSKFYCAVLNGVPITWVRTSRGREQFILWVVKDFSASGFTPLKRCIAVSAKFRRYYDSGTLYITSRSNVNSYPVLCVANRKRRRCSRKNILVTLRPGTDAGRVLKQILAFRRGASNKPVELSGSELVTYENGEFYLDVKALVDTSDVDESRESEAINTDLSEGSESETTNTDDSEILEPRF